MRGGGILKFNPPKVRNSPSLKRCQAKAERMLSFKTNNSPYFSYLEKVKKHPAPSGTPYKREIGRPIFHMFRGTNIEF